MTGLQIKTYMINLFSIRFRQESGRPGKKYPNYGWYFPGFRWNSWRL